ncbi:MAG: phosphoribosyltransferase family protein [Bacteroidales bacterium]
MKTLHKLRSLFFPNNCLMCGTLLANQEDCFCLHCAAKLPRTHFHRQPGNPAEQLFYGKCDIERAVSFCYFEKGSRFRKVIHQFKYNDSPRTAFRLGAFYAQELSRTHWQLPVDLIHPVPLHWSKQLKRGYNQSEWIARGLAKTWQKPLHTHITRKQLSTTSQTRKSLYDRYLNTQGSFRLCEPTLLTGKHILLVDDVLTSGSTLEACAHAIHQAAGVKISILTLGFAE